MGCLGMSIAFLILGSVLVVVWAVYRLFGMWVQDKVISGGEFAAILALMLGLLGGGVTVGGVAALGMLLLLFVVALLITVMPVINQKVGARRLLARDIAQYYAALERQPDVPYPHRKLGEIYEQREDFDRAIEHYQAYVEVHRGSAADVQRSLERCLAAKRRRDMGMRRCPVCGADNPSELARCQECGVYVKGTQEILDTITTPEMMRLWKWLIVVFLVPGLIIGLFPDAIPPVISLLLLMCSVIATLIFISGRMRE